MILHLQHIHDTLSVQKNSVGSAATHLKIIFVTLLLCLSAVVMPSSAARFYTMNDLYGISLRETFSLCKDGHGFVWLAAKTSIVRMTGSECRRYQLPFRTFDMTTCGLLYRHSKLVCYTNNGMVFQYDEPRDHFVLLLDMRTLLHTTDVYVTHVEIDGKGTIWIASTSGLFSFSQQEKYSVSKQEKFKRIFPHGVSYITAMDDSHLFIASGNKVSVMNINTMRSYPLQTVGQKNKLSKNPNDKASNKTSNKQSMMHAKEQSTVTTDQRMLYDRKAQRLWLTSPDFGLCYYDFRQHKWHNSKVIGLPDRSIMSLAIDDDGTLLIGTEGHGAYRIDSSAHCLLNSYQKNTDSQSLRDQSQSLQDNSVHGILCDHDRTYFATYNGGLFILYKHELFDVLLPSYNTTLSSGSEYIRKIVQDRSKRIWLATNNGLLRSSYPISNHQQINSSQQVSSSQQANNNRANPAWNYVNTVPHAEFDAICEDADGQLWIGSFYDGLYILSPDGNLRKHFTPNRSQSSILAATPSANTFPTTTFPATTILDIFRDSNQNMWIGSNNQLYCYLYQQKRFRAYPISPSNAFAEYPKGQLLITNNRGLLYLNTHTGRYKYLITGCLAQDVVVQDNGIVWVATAGKGLIRYQLNTHKKRIFTTANGLPSNYINSLLLSGHRLLVGTEGGFGQMDLRRLTFTDYSSAMHENDQLYNIRACCLLDNGDSYWGTASGLLAFRPSTVLSIQAHCSIYIQDITVSGTSLRTNYNSTDHTSINSLQQLSLRHSDNNFMMELVPIGTTLGIVKFDFYLEGIDEGWNAPTEQHYIHYTNLPAGTYTLHIRALDAAAAHQLATRSIQIIVHPAFWNTWWFRSLLLLLVAALINYIYRSYIRLQKRKYEDEKLRFFTGIAHDLRTSITLINAPLQQLCAAHEFSEKSRYFLKIVTSQSEKLLTVANRLLDFQKVDTGREQLSLSAVDITALVKERMIAFNTLAEQRHITFTPIIPSCPYISSIDQLKAEEVIDNLLSNAIKYSKEGGNVAIQLSTNSQQWTLTVTDHGLGMSKATRQRLFHEFFRGENATNQKILGSGIGLMLVKKYVEMHGGTVAVESKINEGSSFTVTFPKINTKSQKVHNLSKTLESSATIESSTTIESSDKESIQTIFIVEDNDDMRGFLATTLQENYEIHTAHDGSEAWPLIQKQQPDLIISDVMMPNMNGMMLCWNIKSTFDTAHIPVILLTALSDKAHELDGLGLGADDYITKPFDFDILRKRISTILLNRTAVREQASKYATQEDNTTIPTILKNEINDQFVKQAVDVVRNHIADCDFDRDRFATALCVSESLLYKKLKLLTGQSPTDFIRSIRMSYANELLLRHQYSVTEVSDKCGFSSINYFSRAFKKYYGKLPTDV